MPAFTLTIPDTASLPTTTAKLLDALKGIVVSIDEGHGEAREVEVDRAFHRTDGGVNLMVRPWSREHGASINSALIIPLESIEGIEVH